VHVEPITDSHADAVLSIYQSGIDEGNATFETRVPTWEAFSAAIWTIQSSIFPENIASLRLHTSAGFRRIGTRERIAQHHGRWRDVILIERRSGAI
jgi:L-amino acid N-acyltransferase YncA